MAKFLRIVRMISMSVVLIGIIGMAIFWMNDIGTTAPIQMCGIIAVVGVVLSVLLFFAERALWKKEENREETQGTSE